MADFDLRGFIETSFSDWDGKIASILFVPGCNFRCPFCQNKLLITRPESLGKISIEKVEAFLRERKDFIDGIVITGGEPTLYHWLPELCKRFKILGLGVKVDTNGTNPEMLARLLKDKVVDFIAMDYKGPLDERYEKSAKAKVDLKKIKQSVKIVMGSGLDYEFRITVVPTIHDKQVIVDMVQAIPNAKKVVLQQFVNKETLDKDFESIKPYEPEDLQSFAEAAKEYVPNTILRGV